MNEFAGLAAFVTGGATSIGATATSLLLNRGGRNAICTSFVCSRGPCQAEDIEAGMSVPVLATIKP
jgi:hypothetical protein